MKRHHKFWLVILFISSLSGLLDFAFAETYDKAPLRVEKTGKTAKQEMSEHTEDLRALMLKLYTFNPEELAKSTQVGAREMTEWVFDGKANWKFDGIRGQKKMQAIALVFDAEFTGDHILAFIVGLETLLFDAYGGTNEFDIPAVQDEKILSQVQCELQGLLQKTIAPITAGKQPDIITQSNSKQEIEHSLRGIIKRLNAKVANTKNPPC